MDGKKRKMQRLSVFVAAVGLLLAGGCAANGTLSTEKILQGDRAISDAKQGNASLNAPVEIKRAEDKVAEAKTAFANKEYEKAIRLAEQASVDADYARAKATTEKSKKTAEEMRQNIQALRQEIERLSKQ
jgi:cell division protein FtsB